MFLLKPQQLCQNSHTLLCVCPGNIGYGKDRSLRQLHRHICAVTLQLLQHLLHVFIIHQLTQHLHLLAFDVVGLRIGAEELFVVAAEVAGQAPEDLAHVAERGEAELPAL